MKETHMDCTQALEHFDKLHAGDTGGEAAQAAAHVRSCANCRAELAAYGVAVNELRSLPMPASSGKAVERVMGELHEGGAVGNADAPNRIAPFLLLIAAVAAAVIGFIALKGPSESGDDARAGIATDDLPVNDYYLVGAYEVDGRTVAVLGDGKTGQSQVVAEGAALRGGTVHIAADKSVELRSGSGSGTTVRLSAALGADLSGFAAKTQAGALSAGDVRALEAIAYCGEDKAIELLDAAAQGIGPAAERAREATGGDSRALLSALARACRDPKNATRVDSIRSLSRYRTPQSLQTLRAVAAEGSGQAALMAIEGLAAQKDRNALPTLQSLADADKGDVTRAATAAMRQLLK